MKKNPGAISSQDVQSVQRASRLWIICKNVKEGLDFCVHLREAGFGDGRATPGFIIKDDDAKGRRDGVFITTPDASWRVYDYEEIMKRLRMYAKDNENMEIYEVPNEDFKKEIKRIKKESKLLSQQLT